eukprot:760869-Pyramimonas_sp.AAC.1
MEALEALRQGLGEGGLLVLKHLLDHRRLRTHLLIAHHGVTISNGVIIDNITAAIFTGPRVPLTARAQGVRPVTHLREGVPEVVRHHLDELVEEAVLRAELLLAVPHRAPQDAPQHVVAPVVAGPRAVCDGERQRADVVRHHAVGHVAAGGVLRTELA